MIAPADGPAEILGELSRRLGLGYSRTFVIEQVAAHARPGSLLALVEVGAALGLDLAPRKGASDVLDAIGPGDLPVVLHFGAGAGGFGVLTAIDGDRIMLWDSRAGLRAVTRTELVAAWSGVLVLVERGARGVREPGRWRRRLGEAIFLDWQPRVELAGARGSAWTAAVVAIGVIALAACGARGDATAEILVACAAIGAIASFAMTRAGLVAKLCGGGGRVDCASVLGSIYAKVAGVPVSSLALAFFGASSLVMASASLASPARAAACAWWLGAAQVAAVPAVVFFARAQVRLRTLCTLCAIAHAAIVAGAIAALAGTRGTPAAADLAIAAALDALFFVVIVASIAPYLHRADDADAGAGRLARLLASPAVTLAELLAHAPVELDPSLGIAVGVPDAPIEIVAFVHPLCPSCGPVLGELEELIAARPDRIRATIAMSAASHGDAARDRQLRGALAALGRGVPAPALFALYAELKRRGAAAAADPLGVLAELTPFDRAALAALADHEAASCDRSAAFARELGGVPAVFVAGRRTAAPLAHVLAWADDSRLVQERIAPVGRRHEGLLERARGDEAQQVQG